MTTILRSPFGSQGDYLNEARELDQKFNYFHLGPKGNN